MDRLREAEGLVREKIGGLGWMGVSLIVKVRDLCLF